MAPSRPGARHARGAGGPATPRFLPRSSAELHGHLTGRQVVVRVEVVVGEVPGSTHMRSVVAAVDLPSSGPSRLSDAVLPARVELTAVAERGNGNRRRRDNGRSDGNGGRRSGRRECEHSCDEYRNESLVHIVLPMPPSPASASLRSARKRVSALGPTSRAELLHVPMLPDRISDGCVTVTAWK